MSYAFPGYFVQMTNPKVALAWTAIIAIGLGEGAPLWVRSFHMRVCGCCSAADLLPDDFFHNRSGYT